jgi:hypothetical protein
MENNNYFKSIEFVLNKHSTNNIADIYTNDCLNLNLTEWEILVNQEYAPFLLPKRNPKENSNFSNSAILYTNFENVKPKISFQWPSWARELIQKYKFPRKTVEKIIEEDFISKAYA